MVEVRAALRRPSAGRRPLPDFLLIGAQRGGTTSLYRYLATHPSVAPALGKELQYFTLHHGRGEAWYRSHFPVTAGSTLTFEATPYYLFHPLAPERAAATVGGARMVVLLRDPAARAFSHHRHNVSRGLEPLGFEAALDAEPDRLAGEEQRLLEDPGYVSRSHRLFSYVGRGLYVDQLERWFSHFPREQVLVLASEDLYRQPGPTYRSVLDFLGLAPLELPAYPVHTRSSGSTSMAPSTRRRLDERFAPHNRRLAELLGQDLGW